MSLSFLCPARRGLDRRAHASPGQRRSHPARSARLSRLLLGAAVLASSACRGRSELPGAPQLRAVLHLVAARYQTGDQPSTAAVPTVIIGKERRPVLAASHPVTMLFDLLPEDRGREVSFDIGIPDEMRVHPLRLSSTIASWHTQIVEQEPRNLVSPPEEVKLRLTLSDEPQKNSPEHVLITARSAPAEGRYESPPIAVPAGARLRFGVGLDESEWPSGMPGASFTCTAVEDGRESELFHTEIDPARNPSERRWLDGDVDLGPLAGHIVRLRFDSAPLGGDPGAPFIFPVWSDPTIYAPEPAAAERRQIRNLLLISLDTLRPDHLGCYGYQRPTSPTIDSRLAAEGTLFEHAYSAFPGTHGSHMTLFTSLEPCVHGVPGEPGSIGKARPDATTLAEALRAQGYQTAAFHEDAFIMADTGFARGFGVFVENKTPNVRESTGQADVTFPSTLDWIRGHGDAPWFVFMHTYQVHHPYTPPPGYVERVAPGHGRDRDRATRDAALYDGEIRYTDDLLGTFLTGLDEAGASEHTLVILVSDHGEQFGEHGIFGHGNSVLDDLLHVALIMRAPGLVRPGVRIDKRVGLIDVVPTALDLLGMPPIRWTQGRSLAPLLRGETLPPVTLWAELPIRQMIAAHQGDRKWIISRKTGRGELFDLVNDPHERVNLRAGEAPDAVAKLLDEWTATCAAPPRPDVGEKREEIDPAVQEKLKALGYTD